MKKRELIKIVKIPKINDDCQLYFLQYPDQVPFKIQRVYYIKGADINLPRGYHAHKNTRQLFFCIQGEVTLTLDNGKKRERVTLKHAESGVLLDSMIWHEMSQFRTNTIILVLASRVYDSKDYIRDYSEFVKKAHK